jgi:hypothetical protein
VDQSQFNHVPTALSLSGTASSTSVQHSTVTNGPSFITVNGPLSSGPTRWTADLPYVLPYSPVTVPSTGQLTVAAGVVVKVPTTCSSCANSFVVSGSLVISGTATAPVLFTSTRDDSAGGHYGSGTTSTPAAGDWSGLQLNTGASVSMDYVQIRYATTGLSYAASSPTGRLDHVTFTNNGTGVASSSPLTITNSSFTNDSTGISFTGTGYNPTLTASSFTNLSTGIYLNGAITPVIRNSSFIGVSTGVAQSGSTQVDARGNWWGNASGPQPVGTGVRTTGNVNVTPWCTASDCAQAPVFLTAAPPSAMSSGTATTYSFSAAFLPAASFVVGTGALPPGVTLTTDGVLVGTPTTGGVYTFTVMASNSYGTATAGPFTVNVSEAPAFVSPEPPTTASVAEQYSYPFATSGWPAPSVTISQGQLPDGLVLAADGTISGSPTTAGQYSFSVTASNPSGSTTVGPFTIDVAEEPSG